MTGGDVPRGNWGSTLRGEYGEPSTTIRTVMTGIFGYQYQSKYR